MQFHVIGDQSQPAVVLIHGMYMDHRCYDGIVDDLKEDYSIILPILNGHGTDHSVFHSIQEEAEQIIDYLQTPNRSRIVLISGISLGGMIALEVFRQKRIDHPQLFVDGAPFIQFPWFIRRIMEVVFKQTAHSIQKHPQEKSILDQKFPRQAQIMKEVCLRISDESIRNLSEACYTYQLPDANDLDMEKAAFLYGTKEKASQCLPRLRKYTNAQIMVKEGFTHTQFLSDYPQQYADQIKNWITR